MPILSSSSSTSTRNIGLHPLAISSVCDHNTRVIVGGTKLLNSAPVIGLLFGIQSGLDISIIDATDAIYEAIPCDDGWEVLLKTEEIEKKRQLWTAVYTSYELLGWYAVGSEVNRQHMNIHMAMKAFNEAPIFMLMNPNPDPQAKQLPLTILELEVQMQNEHAVQVFVETPYFLETNQAERIAVDMVTKLTPTEGVSTLEVQNSYLAKSLGTLKETIRLLLKALQKIHDGEVDTNHTVLRMAAKICDQLPSAHAGTFGTSFSDELTDSLMLTYLGAVTKSTSDLSQLSDIFAVLYSEGSRRS